MMNFAGKEEISKKNKIFEILNIFLKKIKE